jgi:hypothetical protein
MDESIWLVKMNRSRQGKSVQMWSD